MGPLIRGTPGTPEASVSLSLNPDWFLQPEVMGTCLCGTGTLGWGGGYGAGTPCSLGGTFDAEISLPISIYHIWVWDQPVPHLQPSYQSQCSFFNSLVVGFSFSQILGSSECLLCSSVAILIWLWEDAKNPHSPMSPS